MAAEKYFFGGLFALRVHCNSYSIFSRVRLSLRETLDKHAAHYNSFSGPLHQGHHFGCVTLSDDLNLCEALSNIVPVAFGQVYPECTHVLL